MSLDVSGLGAPTEGRYRVPVSGGVLVFEPATIGKELVGFENVSNYTKLGEALEARGMNRGAIYHLEELDGGDSDD